MATLLYYLIVAAASIAVLIFSADLAVSGIASYARKLGISDFLIGFVVVGVGTSLPEFVSSFTGAAVGEGGIVVGTLLGSLIVSYCLVLGIPAILQKKIKIEKTVSKRKNWPILAIIALMAVLAVDGSLGVVDGIILGLVYIGYLILLWKKEGTFGKLKKDVKLKHIWRDGVIFVGSLIALLLSARWLVFSSVRISRDYLGIEPYILALVVIGSISALPDLIVQIRSIYKGHAQIGTGNVLGSGIINLTIIPALVVLINPIKIDFMMVLPAFIAGMIIVALVLNIIKKGVFLRKHGVILAVVYAVFKMNKKAQITLYIILGLIIVMGVILVINLREPEQELVPTLDTAPIRYYIESCIETTGEQAIKVISQQGGYYILPEKSIYDVPIYYFEGQSLIPGEDILYSSLNQYINDKIAECLDFSGFEEYNIQTEQHTTTTRLSAQSLVINLEYPVKISRDMETAELNQFTVTIPTKLKKMYDVGNEIIINQDKDPDFMLVTDVIDIVERNSITYMLEEDDDGNVVYVLVDREPIVSEFPEQEPKEGFYEFKFAIKYVR